MRILDGVVQTYEWGSRTAIAELTGRAMPTDKPEAELWMGAHPNAPSAIRGEGTTLLDLVKRDPIGVLGEDVATRFGGFPFLLKVLAADAPLSLQAHPSKAQAERGFADEEARGVPRTAANRNYKDDNHKPELLCAVTRFEALCGFRDTREMVRLLDVLQVDALAPERALFEKGDVKGAFRSIMERSGEDREKVVVETLLACARELSTEQGAPFASSLVWALKLGDKYPGDVGAVSSLFLNQLVLWPGEAIYLPAGNLHAYLSGVGVEIMASSDNVLRGGLTPKHVDVPELLDVLVFDAGPIKPMTPVRRDTGEEVYETPAPDFRLSRIVLNAGERFAATPAGPEIVLVTDGAIRFEDQAGSALSAGMGESVLLTPSDGRCTLRGEGVMYRATVGPLS